MDGLVHLADENGKRLLVYHHMFHQIYSKHITGITIN